MSDKALSIRILGRHALLRCEYGVPSDKVSNDVMNCGEPAVAKWVWPSGTLHVCEEHDEIIEMGEDNEANSN